MERLFLLSDVPPGYGQQVIHSVTHQFQPIISILNDFENISASIEKYPAVTWIVCDIERDSEWLARFLNQIPVPNYIVNFSGPEFDNLISSSIRSSGVEITKRERDRSELTFFGGLVKDEDGQNCTVLVNVVEKRSSLEKKSRGVSKAVGRLVKGVSKTLNEFKENDGDEEDDTTPLLGTPAGNPGTSSTVPVAIPSSEGFFASLLSCCCPCIFPPELRRSFQSPEELRAFIRTEQIKEIQKAFEKLHQKELLKWANNLEELRMKESQKLEQLTEKVSTMKEEEEKQLSDVASQQNKNTRDNLSNVLSAETIKRIEASRSRQNKGKVDCDSERAYREGKDLIRKQVQIDREQLVQRHYSSLLEEQLRKVTEINQKFKERAKRMHERHFGNVV